MIKPNTAVKIGQSNVNRKLTRCVFESNDLGIGKAHREAQCICELVGGHVSPDQNTMGLSLVLSLKFKH